MININADAGDSPTKFLVQQKGQEAIGELGKGQNNYYYKYWSINDVLKDFPQIVAGQSRVQLIVLKDGVDKGSHAKGSVG